MQELVFAHPFTRLLGYPGQAPHILARESRLAGVKVFKELYAGVPGTLPEQVVAQRPEESGMWPDPLPTPMPPVNRGSIRYWQQ